MRQHHRTWELMVAACGVALLASIATLAGCRATDKPDPAHPGIRTVALVPLGSVDPRTLDSIAVAVRCALGVRVVRLEQHALPGQARSMFRTERYRADSLLNYLGGTVAGGDTLVLGVTRVDVSTTKRDPDGSIRAPIARYRDFGVFGLAQLRGRAGLISTFRLQRAPTTTTVTERICKVAIHEVGHMLGLQHCPDTQCVMRDALEHLASIDVETRNPCKRCQQRIANN